MGKRCTVALVIITVGVFMLYFFVTYANANSVAQLRTDLKAIEGKVTEIYKYVDFVRKNIAWILGALGISIWGVIKLIGLYVKKRFGKEIDKAIYKVDPTYMSIKAPASDFDHESERLKKLGFKNVTTYSFLDNSCLSGCVIYSAHNVSEAEVLKNFIVDKNPDQYKVGYVLYTRDRIDPSLFKDFNNITYANSPLTLINAVYAVARGTIK
jgi:hypothetical protein